MLNSSWQIWAWPTFGESKIMQVQMPIQILEVLASMVRHFHTSVGRANDLKVLRNVTGSMTLTKINHWMSNNLSIFGPWDASSVRSQYGWFSAKVPWYVIARTDRSQQQG